MPTPAKSKYALLLGTVFLNALSAFHSPSFKKYTGKIWHSGRSFSECYDNGLSENEKIEPKVSDLRKVYTLKGLDETVMDADPMIVFGEWFEEACKAKVLEPNAMCLSTCSDNKPSARFVLLKGFDQSGFVFYTNYNSRKSADLIENPYAALTFLWGDLERSVRIEGKVEKIEVSESEAYFQSRPRESKIGAWASNQSSPIDSRSSLEKQQLEIEERFRSIKDIPKPSEWGGFRVRPSLIEFWKGREGRLHDRIVYKILEKENCPNMESSLSRIDVKADWSKERLQP